MMSLHVIPYNQARFTCDFSRASIYIDACFFLAYLDSENEKGDKAAHLIDLWEKSNVTKVGFSNHTFIEVVNNIFNNRVMTAMVLQRRFNKNVPLDSDEVSMIGDRGLANRLIQLAGEDRLDRYIAGEDVRFYVPRLIKDIKAERHYRSQLDFHYNGALDEFRELVQIFTLKNIRLDYPASEAVDQHLANSMMRTMQLDAPDALHLAVATNHEYGYFITMDSDFTNSHYSGPQLCAVTIIDLAA